MQNIMKPLADEIENSKEITVQIDGKVIKKIVRQKMKKYKPKKLSILDKWKLKRQFPKIGEK